MQGEVRWGGWNESEKRQNTNFSIRSSGRMRTLDSNEARRSSRPNHLLWGLNPIELFERTFVYKR